MNTLDARHLIDAGRDIKTPFRLLVSRPEVGQVEIIALSVLRLLPARRLVALAEVDGTKVVIKMFLGQKVGKYIHRERSGVLALARSGIRTPRLLWEGKTENSALLVFQYLPDGVDLNDWWSQSLDLGERVKILEMVMEVMSSLHDHGVVQNDIHLGNFLFCDGKINTIDGDAVEQNSEAPLAEHASLKNLALFFAQLYPRYDVLIGEALATYESERGWEMSRSRLRILKQTVLKSRETRKRNYIAKTFRDCTRFLCRHTFKRFEVIDRGACSRELEDLIEDPDRFIESGTILKTGNSSTVALVKLIDRSVVVKRYNIKNFRHGLGRAFRKSRAWLSWANAHRMEFLGIPALKPIALIENRLGPIRTTAYLITEFIEGPDALSCLTGTENPVGQLESLVDILQKLSEVRVSHGDLKATNFVMSEQGAVLIDLDAMKEHRSQQGFKQAFSRDLQRFLKNWSEYPLLNAQFSELLRDLCARYNVKP